MQRFFLPLFILFFSFFHSVDCRAIFEDIFPKLPDELLKPGQGKVLQEGTRAYIASQTLAEALLKPTPTKEVLESVSAPLKENFHMTEPVRLTGDWREQVKSVCAENGWEQMPLIGYGSLLDTQTSTEFPASQEIDSRTPLLALGLMRSFTHVPLEPEKSYLGLPDGDSDKQILRLSVNYTGSSTDLINGVELKVGLDAELDALWEREQGYELLLITALNCVCADENVFAEASEARLKRVFILCTPQQTASLDTTLQPHMSYLHICLRGAAELDNRVPSGLSFSGLFLHTTYMPCGEMTVASWLQEMLERGCKKRTALTSRAKNGRRAFLGRKKSLSSSVGDIQGRLT